MPSKNLPQISLNILQPPAKILPTYSKLQHFIWFSYFFGPETVIGLIRWRHTIRNGTFLCESLGISCFWFKFWDSRHVQLAIYTVLDEESESEFKKCQILEPGREKQEKLIYKYYLSCFFNVLSFLNPMNGLINNFFEKSTPYETVANAMKSTQNLTPGRF